MERRKLFVTFEESNIEIVSEKGAIALGIPYHFDIESGENNLRHLLEVLGFDVEIKKGEKKKEEKIHLYKKSILVPMTYSDLTRLISWLRHYIEKGNMLETLKIMIELIERLEAIAKSEENKYMNKK